MRICAVTKYPPIEGGVSARCFWIARALARRGHQVHVVTNAGEVEDGYRIWVPPVDRSLLEASFGNGGRVTVTSTGLRRRGLFHVPDGNPFATKLASLATEVVRRERCEVLFSYYYEPYGLSGHLAASWTGVPHVVQHAGSDQGRLLNHPELSLAYRELLRHAATVVSSSRAVEGLGVPSARLARVGTNFLPQDHFNAAAVPMDVDVILAELAAHPFARNPGPWRSDLPTFGVLGKVGELKGSYDLVAALARLRARGHEFNLLAMVAGADRDRFLAAVADANLGQCTWALPLLPHWRVPSFLRRCTAVCFLERRFTIQAHRPGIPQEILACGVCAVLSREIVDKQHCRERLHDRQNVLVVEDPADHDELTAVLESVVRDPGQALAIGAAGAAIVEAGDLDDLGRAYERLLHAAIERHRGHSAAQEDPVTDARAFLARHAPATLRLMAVEVDRSLEQANEGPGVAQIAYRALDQLVRDASDDRDPRLGVARWERDLLWLAVDLESPTGIPQFPRPAGALARHGGPPRPVRSNWLRISEHPAGIERAVGDHARLDASRRADYVFHKRGDLTRHVFRVNTATRLLIELCDGSRDLAQLEAELAARGVNAEGRLAEMVGQLASEGVLQFA
jgi:glycosyltransferase involved in cell wall biosynthesis